MTHREVIGGAVIDLAQCRALRFLMEAIQSAQLGLYENRCEECDPNSAQQRTM